MRTEDGRSTSVQSLRAAALAGVSVVALAGTSFAATPQLHHLDTSKWKAMLPHELPTAKARLAKFRAASLHGLSAGLTVPYWTTSITSPLDGQTYQVSMVGSSPYDPSPHNTNVTYVPVAVRIHLDGLVIDPTVPTPSYGGPHASCDTQSAARRFFNSPIFRPTTIVSNGRNVSAIPGGTQLESAFQRANFWQAVKGNTLRGHLGPVPARSDRRGLVSDRSPRHYSRHPRPWRWHQRPFTTTGG